MIGSLFMGGRNGIGGPSLGFVSLVSDNAAGGDSPTVFTLVLDDLLTRRFTGKNQQMQLTLGGPAPGDTASLTLDTTDVTSLAANIQAAIIAINGTLTGLVTVSGVETNAGDTQTFTITFDASLEAVTLAFHASSQWYPTITLTEAVTQQGVADVAGVYEVSQVQAIAVENGVTGDTTTDNNGNSVTCDGNGTYASHVTASNWTNGTPGNPMSFTCDSYGPQGTVIGSGNGSVTRMVLGVTPVTGQPEIHTITPTPASPTGGTWKPYVSGSAVGYADGAAPIAGVIGNVFDPANSAQPSVSGGIESGPITITAPSNGVLADDVLSPVNVSLTAPEITHSIS